MIVVVDLETFYSKDYSLTKLTYEEYVRHPDFEVIGASIKMGEEPAQWYTGSLDYLKSVFNSIDWSDKFVLCHNTAFDATILSWVFNVKPRAWFDTMCMARAIDGVDVSASLAACAQRHGLQAKGDEVVRAIGKRRADFSPEDLAAYGDYCRNDVEITKQLFDIYSKNFPRNELKLIDLTLRMAVEPALFINTTRLTSALETIKAAKADALSQAHANCHEIGEQDLATVLRSNAKFAKLLGAMGVSVPMKVSPRTNKETPALAKNDDGLKDLMVHEDPRVRAVVEARLSAKSSIEETRAQRLLDIGNRGLLPVTLKVYGARTGRWSADGATNMQNLPRKSLIKGCIEAPQGYTLVGADLSNIELRVGLWIAGQTDKLTLLQGGVDLYKDFASMVFNKPADQIDKDERQIGKTSQLSLIYGTGNVKLRKTLKQQMGKDLGAEKCKDIVDSYRHTYANVANVWRRAGLGISAMYEDELFTFGTQGIGRVDGKNGLLLPSGLHMRYPDLKQTEDDEGNLAWYYVTRKGKDKLYGAKLFQGLTQAVARCVMADQLLALSKKYKVVLTVHDSVYLLVKEHEAEAVLQDTLEIMRTTPSYLPGIVLDAEAGIGKSLLDV